jgi:hypothetical protein
MPTVVPGQVIQSNRTDPMARLSASLQNLGAMNQQKKANQASYIDAYAIDKITNLGLARFAIEQPTVFRKWAEKSLGFTGMDLENFYEDAKNSTMSADEADRWLVDMARQARAIGQPIATIYNENDLETASARMEAESEPEPEPADTSTPEPVVTGGSAPEEGVMDTEPIQGKREVPAGYKQETVLGTIDIIDKDKFAKYIGDPKNFSRIPGVDASNVRTVIQQITSTNLGQADLENLAKGFGIPIEEISSKMIAPTGTVDMPLTKEVDSTLASGRNLAGRQTGTPGTVTYPTPPAETPAPNPPVEAPPINEETFQHMKNLESQMATPDGRVMVRNNVEKGIGRGLANYNADLTGRLSKSKGQPYSGRMIYPGIYDNPEDNYKLYQAIVAMASSEDENVRAEFHAMHKGMSKELLEAIGTDTLNRAREAELKQYLEKTKPGSKQNLIEERKLDIYLKDLEQQGREIDLKEEKHKLAVREFEELKKLRDMGSGFENIRDKEIWEGFLSGKLTKEDNPALHELFISIVNKQIEAGNLSEVEGAQITGGWVGRVINFFQNINTAGQSTVRIKGSGGTTGALPTTGTGTITKSTAEQIADSMEQEYLTQGQQ